MAFVKKYYRTSFINFDPIYESDLVPSIIKASLINSKSHKIMSHKKSKRSHKFYRFEFMKYGKSL